jgi:hypothetical protein
MQEAASPTEIKNRKTIEEVTADEFVQQFDPHRAYNVKEVNPCAPELAAMPPAGRARQSVAQVR